MRNTFFSALESNGDGQTHPLPGVLDQLSFNRDGLIPVVAQDHDSREVLMMAWMNREAIDQTLSSGAMTYWSRSRAQFWRKGESSGNRQQLIEMRIDCDGDTILCLVRQHGPACHTGRPNCFYLQVDAVNQVVSVRGSPGK